LSRALWLDDENVILHSSRRKLIFRTIGAGMERDLWAATRALPRGRRAGPMGARKSGISGALLYKCVVKKRAARVNRKEHSPIRLQAKFFRGLADVSRLSILEVLREGRKTVTEVAREAHLSQPNASMHLNCLWECGLVEREVGRRNTFYWIGSRDVVRLLEMGIKVLGSVKDRIAACARFCED